MAEREEHRTRISAAAVFTITVVGVVVTRPLGVGCVWAPVPWVDVTSALAASIIFQPVGVRDVIKMGGRMHG